jgi:Ca2+-binding RTX toxin-like protein
MQSIAGLLVISTRGGASTVILDDSGNIDSGLDRTVTFTADPTYNMIVDGLAPANIYLPVAAGANVSVTGDAADETFAIDGLPSGFNLQIDGQSGANTLDYSGYTGDVSVNLAQGAATGLSGIRNIENVTGGKGDNLLVGDANANVLVGGSGRNILIGGGGADQLMGGAGDNILIGGTTDYDTIDAALQALMHEWERTDVDFKTRIADLMAGVVSGSTEYSLTSATVHADGAADSLFHGAHNWFFVAQSDPDTIDEVEDGDVVTPI